MARMLTNNTVNVRRTCPTIRNDFQPRYVFVRNTRSSLIHSFIVNFVEYKRIRRLRNEVVVVTQFFVIFQCDCFDIFNSNFSSAPLSLAENSFKIPITSASNSHRFSPRHDLMEKFWIQVHFLGENINRKTSDSSWIRFREKVFGNYWIKKAFRLTEDSYLFRR